ncbi:MAG: hypothetical protein ACO1RT_18995 [Planctomycetaceae bacterium]
MPRPLVDPPLRRDVVAQRLGIELPACLASDRTPWHTVVCSHLGRDLLGHQTHIAMLFRFIEDAMHQGYRSLAVCDTAAARWMTRACVLLGNDPVRLSAGVAKPPWLAVNVGTTVCRDRLAIELADRVDATFVRPRGTIMRLLCKRLQHDPSSAVQVLVTDAADDAAKRLIDCGAIGYCITAKAPLAARCGLVPSSIAADTDAAFESLMGEPERWLIHSTRARSGPWPGESQQQFIDGLLLRPPSRESSSPLGTLERIVRERRLVGTHRTTASAQPVVCFSGLPIRDWLARRTFRPHLGRWDAEPYGVAVNREAAERCGVLPVIYGEHPRHCGLGKADLWRFQAIGHTYDWTGEQEWRGRGVLDLSRFAVDEVIVFVQHPHECELFAQSPWAVVDIAARL